MNMVTDDLMPSAQAQSTVDIKEQCLNFEIHSRVVRVKTTSLEKESTRVLDESKHYSRRVKKGT